MSAVDDFVALVDGWLGENERERLKIQQLRAAALAIAAGETPPAAGTTGTLSEVVADLVALRMQLLGLVDRLETGPRPSGAPTRQNGAPRTPRGHVSAAPGRGGRRRTDNDVRALWAGYDPARSFSAFLDDKGVPHGSRDGLVKRARRLGLLPVAQDDLGGREPHIEAPTPPASAPAPRVDPPAEPLAAKPGKGRHRTDDEIRALCDGLDPAVSYYRQLRERGVASGSIDKVINKGRTLGVLPRRLDVASPAQNGNGEQPPEPSEATTNVSGNGSAAAAEHIYTDAEVRDLWEALDPAIDVRSQLTDAGVPQRDQGYIRTRARHLGLEMLGGELTKTKSWAVANTPLKGPAVSKEPGRSSLKLVLCCTSCDHTAATAGAMEIHCRDTHGRPSTRAERTPLTAAEALARGVAS